jgi:ABC-type sugar transport system permease subunit
MGMGAAITTLMIAVLMVFFVVYYRLRCAEERV